LEDTDTGERVHDSAQRMLRLVDTLSAMSGAVGHSAEWRPERVSSSGRTRPSPARQKVKQKRANRPKIPLGMKAPQGSLRGRLTVSNQPGYHARVTRRGPPRAPFGWEIY